LNAARSEKIKQLVEAASASFSEGSFRTLDLSKPLPAAPDAPRAQALSGAEKILMRPVLIKGAPHLCTVLRFASKDITKNLAPAQAWLHITNWLEFEFANAHLVCASKQVNREVVCASKQVNREVVCASKQVNGQGIAEGADWQLITSRKGTAELRRVKLTATAPDTQAGHNRTKHDALALATPFLHALGIAQFGPRGEAQLVASMAHKYKQITKFLEIFRAALEKSDVANKPDLRVLDFGAGKGYLTFALEHYLAARHTEAAAHRVTGVELRQELVNSGNTLCAQLGLRTLEFVAGDVSDMALNPETLDVMVALHACDTATDFAIHHGIVKAAALILCAPCCHKQLRPQMQAPSVLLPMFKHGVHLGQEADMLTDSLRALLLEARGYQTQVFEFVATEHTAKNKMILAVRRTQPLTPTRQHELAEQIAALKAFYGVQEHCLEALLTGAA
jgi:SAM-dependent methyltransferase